MHGAPPTLDDRVDMISKPPLQDGRLTAWSFFLAAFASSDRSRLNKDTHRHTRGRETGAECQSNTTIQNFVTKCHTRVGGVYGYNPCNVRDGRGQRTKSGDCHLPTPGQCHRATKHYTELDNSLS